MGNLNIDLKAYKMMNEKSTVLPNGDYAVAIEVVNEKQTKSGDGSYLSVKLKVITGPFEGQSIWHNLNINNKNEKAQNIGRSELKTLAYAAQLPNYEFINDTNDMLGLRLLITVEIEDKNDQYGPKNVIKAYQQIQKTGSIASDVPF